MNVRDLMTISVQTCRAYETLNAAAQKMWEADIGAVPVLDDKNHAVGMLTDRDICMAAYTQGRPLSEIVAAEVMSKRIISCRATDTVSDAEQLMRAHRIRRLPVVDGERHVVGIVSINDIARAIARTRRGESELVTTMATICTPRGIDERQAAAR